LLLRLTIAVTVSAATLFAVLLGARSPHARRTLVPITQTPVHLPRTDTGIHIGIPFLRCYNEWWHPTSGGSRWCRTSSRRSIASIQRAIDIGWTYTYKYAGFVEHHSAIGAAFDFDRTPGYDVDSRTGAGHPFTLAYWRRSHPDWLEYTCVTDAQGNHTHPAYEYRDVPKVAGAPTYAPVNIADPAVRKFMFDNYYKPSIDAGYPILFFDNFSLHDFSGRCGHYDLHGHWVAQYSGSRPWTYERDSLNWLRWVVAETHRYKPGELVAVNYNPAATYDTPQQYDSVYKLVDIVWNEEGFTYWGNFRLSTANSWRAEVSAMSDVAQRIDKGLVINGELKKSYGQVTESDREWVIANYLLVKGAHTYVGITIPDYGYFWDFPIYHLAIGSPAGQAHESQNVYVRAFTHGEAIVNPDPSRTIVVHLDRPDYRDTDGRAVPSTLAVPPVSGVVLIR
jgi:hypothetical protein